MIISYNSVFFSGSELFFLYIWHFNQGCEALVPPKVLNMWLCQKTKDFCCCCYCQNQFFASVSIFQLLQCALPSLLSFSYSILLNGPLRGSHGLSAQMARRTKQARRAQGWVSVPPGICPANWTRSRAPKTSYVIFYDNLMSNRPLKNLQTLTVSLTVKY